MSWCDIPEFFTEAYPVARKDHDCCECSAPIKKGERYGRFTGKWNESVRTYNQHLDCEKACTTIRDEFQSGECIGFGSLHEYFREYTGGRSHKRSRWREEDSVKDFRETIARIMLRERKEVKERGKRWIACAM